MPVAVGTSLVVIAMKSFAGFAGYLESVSIDWGLAAVVTIAAIAGSVIGARLAGRIPADTLRKAFGWFVVAMGTFVLVQQLPAHLRTSPLLLGGLAAALVAAGIVATRTRTRTRHAAAPLADNLTAAGQPPAG